MQTGEELYNTYVIRKRLGAGGISEVYLAFHKRLQMNMVVKRTRIQQTNVIQQRTEADILKLLHHPGIPIIHDFFRDREFNYVVMEYITGASFEELLQRGVSFNQMQVLEYSRQLCQILQYLHGMKPPIIHGDIKPSNVMLTKDNTIVLLDFNVAGFCTSQSMQVLGFSKAFASPEQQRMNEQIDLRSDIYSLGAWMQALLPRKKQGIIFRYLVKKAMQEQVKRRFQSVDEMLKIIKGSS